MDRLSYGYIVELLLSAGILAGLKDLPGFVDVCYIAEVCDARGVE